MAETVVDLEMIPFNSVTTKDESEAPSTAGATSEEQQLMNRNSSYVSLNSLQGDVCRICHCEAEPGIAPLISPCACCGTLRYVHQACLQQWIKSANAKSCELCKVDFHMTTSMKPFRSWQKLEMTKVEKRKIFCSVTFHAIAITCVIWSLYVLIDRTSEEVRSGMLEWPFWTKLIVVAIGFAGGIVFMYVQCRMYLQLCRRWRAYNRVIYVQDCPSTRLTSANGGGHCKSQLVDASSVDSVVKTAEQVSGILPISSNIDCVDSSSGGVSDHEFNRRRTQ